MNKTVITTYVPTCLSLLYVPLFFLTIILFFLYKQDALNIDAYIGIQEHWFFFLNSKLSKYPVLQYNLTQLGDALVLLPFLSIFVMYAPKIWQSLLSASLVSAFFCNILKKLFTVPRPAAVFDNEAFVIIGKTLSGHTSLPSGHSITIFTTITILMFAFMPQKLKYKVIWCSSLLISGLIIAFTRVAVGAHYPLDVIIGSIIGYISGLLGIFINHRYNIWEWINLKKYYPVFILLFSICAMILINKILNENLIIFYLSLISLLTSLYIITYSYAKK
ncbi:phosphatase PAP2 family protein [Chryseobacterium indologenes]|uniref:Phosphatase PAP2 family protein n=1 Tax=Chryseobacterium indologenes TaxID=253 RepID=A0AAD0YUZ3_CHRID|nr:phosphatase PAP2 family protein [Chryseobacterium indologenes]ASE62249.1 phosphatase PAP2 family protein [Chryseobacterium indologenes]AZB17963.1 phosphatase PAP2 family protein [Chryseobacterium indologenes]QPQ52250.1 phosphatase PAP2 family protein [Chryseobacterium indologenes]SFJ91316.1 PAP2 superfamily protein [Chryseobacterium indologenes]SUX50862.1 undecaprenyl pyrophosphate phosphatase [Chryseobacterium indologenes]